VLQLTLVSNETCENVYQYSSSENVLTLYAMLIANQRRAVHALDDNLADEISQRLALLSIDPEECRGEARKHRSYCTLNLEIHKCLQKTPCTTGLDTASMRIMYCRAK